MPFKGSKTAGVHYCAVYSAGLLVAVVPEENSPCGFSPAPSRTVVENQREWMLLSSPHTQDVEKRDFSSYFFPGKKCVCTLRWIKKAMFKRFWNRNSSLLQNEPQWKPDFISLWRMTKHCQALTIADWSSCNSMICGIILTWILIFLNNVSFKSECYSKSKWMLLEIVKILTETLWCPTDWNWIFPFNNFVKTNIICKMFWSCDSISQRKNTALKII